MATRKKLVITPDRVRKKIRECLFYVEKMEEAANDPGEEFGFYLSAFLSSLKSIENLAPLADHKRQMEIRNEIRNLRNNHPPLNYLLTVRDAEVHREGVQIVMDLMAAFRRPQHGFTFPSARRRLEGAARFQSRFESRFSVRSSIYQPFYRHTWVFPDNAQEVVHTCQDSLNLLIQQVTTSLGL